jgi:hypothetical protein
MSLEMAHKVIVPQKKIMSQSFLNSGTLVIICTRVLLCTVVCVVVCCWVFLCVVVCCCVLEGCGGLLVHCPKTTERNFNLDVLNLYEIHFIPLFKVK